jgi:hypothetical protein
MSQRPPKVSVTIPSYNHARYLPAAIESVLAQTYRDFELIITDDGSTDGSLQIAQSYAARNPSLIRVLTHPGHRNLGISPTANLNFRESRGEYWAGVCSDDVWLPDKLERQVAFIESRPAVGLVYGRAQVINEDGELQPTVIGEDISDDPDPVSRLLREKPIPAPTVLLRRRCLEETGLHAEGVTYGDWEQWVRILAHWDAGFIDQTLMLYRVHSYNTSANIDPRLHLQYMTEAMLEIRRRAPEVGGRLARPRTRALVELQLSHMQFSAGDAGAAAASLGAAFAADPSLASDPAYLDEWLRGTTAEVYDASAGAGADFRTWALDALATLAGASCHRRLRGRVRGRQLADAAFESYKTDLGETRRLALRCLLSDPRWLGDRLFQSIFAESLLGARLTNYLRRRRAGPARAGKVKAS